MKFTTKQLSEFALRAGVPLVEIVDDEKDSDYNEDVALQSVHAAVLPIIKPAIESELTKSLETSLKGKFSGETYSLLARESGLTRAELEKLPVPEAAKLAFTHLSTKLGSDSEKWKKEMDNMLLTHTKAIEEKDKEHNSKLSAAEKRYIDRDVKAFLLDNVVSKSPLSTTADKAYYAELLHAHLEQKYHVSYNDVKKSVELFMKDNIQMPALNEAKTAAINPLDEFKPLATRAGVWQTDTRHMPPNPNPKNPINPNPNPAPPKPASAGQGKRVSAADIAAKLEQLEGAA